MRKILLLSTAFIFLSGFNNADVNQTLDDVREIVGTDIEFEETLSSYIYTDDEYTLYKSPEANVFYIHIK